ncbi:hypothetical protein A8A01_15480 [Ewingella americana]|nr:hypothetical protein A8A01_15480 [Ewingella americana]
MKLFRNVILPLSFLISAATPAFAAKEVNNAQGLVKIGTVSDSSSNALSLSELNDNLSMKADKAGASAYRIIAAGGNNSYYGVAEIYR